MTAFAHLHGQIRVLKISWRELLAKSPELSPKSARDHQRGARNVVNLSQIAVPRVIGIAIATHIPRVAGTPNHATGFLQAPVGVDKLGSGQPYAVEVAKHGHKLIDPSRRNLGIIVEKRDEFALRVSCTQVAGINK